MTEAAFWFVEGRRASIRQRVSYHDLVQEWLVSIERAGAAFERWYDLDGAGRSAARAAVRAWADAMFADAEAVRAARGEVATLNAGEASFRPRLWKGPLRVLLEARTGSAALGDEIAVFNDVTFDHGGPVVLRLNEAGEVTNADAEFLVGDVVEFPLFKFLAAGGLTAYGNAPRFDDVLQFNGEGSFLLNTAIKTVGGESPPSSPALHDNLVAMRFQMLLNGALSAFYHLDERVFASDVRRAQSVTDGAHTVYARGFMYAGTLAGPHVRTRPGPEHWRLVNYHWGATRGGDIARSLPTKSALADLGDNLPVTPGMTCSPATLTLSYFMMRHWNEGSFGRGGSVGKTMLHERQAAIQDTYEMWRPEDVAELVPQVPEPELREKLNTLIDNVRSVYEQLTRDSGFLRSVYDDAQTWPGWEDNLPRATRTRLQREVGSPVGTINHIRSRFRGRRVSDEEKTMLERYHAELVAGIHQFRADLDELLESEEWQAFVDIGPDFSRPAVAGYVQEVREVSCPGGRCRYRHAHRQLESLRGQLRRKLRRLEQRRDNRRPLSSGSRSREIDFTPHLTDVNTISMHGHEIAVVCLYPHDNLLTQDALPSAGFVAAYHPLTGQPFLDDTCVAGGQYYLFESTGTLKRCTSRDRGYSLFGCRPFRWARIERNKFTVRVQERGDNVHVWVSEAGRRRTKRLQGIIKLNGGGRGTEQLAQTLDADPQAMRPMLVHPVGGAADVATAKRRLIANGMMLYHARAVPFPSLAEVRDAFATVADVRGHQRRIKAQIEADLPAAEEEAERAFHERETADGRNEERQAARRLRLAQRQVSQMNTFINNL